MQRIWQLATLLCAIVTLVWTTVRQMQYEAPRQIHLHVPDLAGDERWSRKDVPRKRAPHATHGEETGF